MGGKGAGGGFGEAAAAWLRAAMRSPKTGRDKMNHSEIIRAAHISRATFYRLLSGKAEDVAQATFDGLAKALKVPAPRVDLLRFRRLDEGEFTGTPCDFDSQLTAPR